MKDFINGQMTDEVKAATNTQIFSINQTDKGQGHIIIDYPRLLNHGLGELVAQMQQHCQQQPENHFYQAALLLLEASQKHILRYAELAETMAANCTDAQRREELLILRRSPAITRNISRRRSGRRASILVHEHHSAIRIQRQFAIVGALRPVYVAVLSDIINPGRRCGVPERTARIFMGEMQRHRAVALHQ